MAPDTRELALATNQRAPHQQTDGLNRYLITAFPATGGTTMQRRQNYFLTRAIANE
jgi:hypothetical protein